jgi:NAD(P)-dependent dehydrogenase (short-subunit alcohol dehydrogenase family)
MKWLDAQSTLVTGGASGLGLAIVERFLAEGARVTVLDRNAEALERLSARLGTAIATVSGDVRSLSDNKRAVETAVARFGKLDTLIANAGIWDFNVPLVDLPEDRIDAAFDEIFGILVKGYLLGAKAALPALVRARGSIVFTLSNAAFYPGGGGPLYTAAKHAGVGLVRELAYEFAPHVRVNGVAPGLIPSDMRGARSLDQEERSVAAMFPAPGSPFSSPLARVPHIEEYTSSYVLLASANDAKTITGVVINADSGLGVRGLRGPRGGDDLSTRFGEE